MKRCITLLLTVTLLCNLFVCAPLRVDAAKMTSSDAFIEILKKREGFEKYPYKDNTQWSIGYGTRVPEGKLEYYQEHGITEAEAEKLMRDMLVGFEKAVLDFSAKYGFSLTQHQFDALVSFSYNCGDAWTKDSDGTMNRAVREGWTGSDFVYAICLWSKSAGKYILINRRLYEANMYLNALYESPYNHESGSFRYVFLDAGQAKTEYEIHGYDIRDPKPIRYKFKNTPTGTDSNGKAFTYEFAGWYTAPENGKLVEVLDDSLESGSLLYGLWKDPSGKLVYLPKGEACNLVVSVTKVNESLTIRSGPGTQYSKVGELKKNATVTLTRVYNNDGDLWGQFKDGWISLEYTNYNEVINESGTWPKSGVVNADGVNVRSGPGTSNAMQYKLNKGDSVTIHEQKYVDGMYWGKLDDGNWISLNYVTFDQVSPKPDPEPQPLKSADVNGNGTVDKDDAIYLLRHVVYPDKYPISVNCDVNGSGVIDKDDAVYLLRHVVYPDKYPLKLGE